MTPDRRGADAELGPGATTRLVVSGVLGAASGVAAGTVVDWPVGLLLGWIVAAGVYVGWLWVTVAHMDGVATATHAAREDPGRRPVHLLVNGAALVSLGAVALLLVGRSGGAAAEVGRAVLSVASVALAWVTVHTAFTTRYAHLYYTSPVPVVDFGDVTQPSYTDFAYLAFTIGMTFQVSDTQLKTTAMRRAVLEHALFSYVIGVVAIAATVNLLAGLRG
ncbi:DUF1345 domain-containing protein [Georgenia thermotolerans]|uniref:DUF1345 domain-containing protein n=1 Tax=Georgenia thermotolerans TaxID=527326 RepID=A0A7J5UKH1_9MICO|nr:DUF1345 domain-containing protein [Georgenia thermotolerans]KAE8762905.1 DUF1345 domain-containing protein [Georgenia thermotolerans]